MLKFRGDINFPDGNDITIMKNQRHAFLFDWYDFKLCVNIKPQRKKNCKIDVLKLFLYIAWKCNQSFVNFQFWEFKIQGLDNATLLQLTFRLRGLGEHWELKLVTWMVQILNFSIAVIFNNLWTYDKSKISTIVQK